MESFFEQSQLEKYQTTEYVVYKIKTILQDIINTRHRRFVISTVESIFNNIDALVKYSYENHNATKRRELYNFLTRFVERIKSFLSKGTEYSNLSSDFDFLKETIEQLKNLEKFIPTGTYPELLDNPEETKEEKVSGESLPTVSIDDEPKRISLYSHATKNNIGGLMRENPNGFEIPYSLSKLNNIMYCVNTNGIIATTNVNNFDDPDYYVSDNNHAYHIINHLKHTFYPKGYPSYFINLAKRNNTAHSPTDLSNNNCIEMKSLPKEETKVDEESSPSVSFASEPKEESSKNNRYVLFCKIDGKYPWEVGYCGPNKIDPDSISTEELNKLINAHNETVQRLFGTSEPKEEKVDEESLPIVSFDSESKEEKGSEESLQTDSFEPMRSLRYVRNSIEMEKALSRNSNGFETRRYLIRDGYNNIEYYVKSCNKEEGSVSCNTTRVCDFNDPDYYNSKDDYAYHILNGGYTFYPKGYPSYFIDVVKRNNTERSSTDLSKEEREYYLINGYYPWDPKYEGKKVSLTEYEINKVIASEPLRNLYIGYFTSWDTIIRSFRNGVETQVPSVLCPHINKKSIEYHVKSPNKKDITVTTVNNLNDHDYYNSIDDYAYHVFYGKHTFYPNGYPSYYNDKIKSDEETETTEVPTNRYNEWINKNPSKPFVFTQKTKKTSNVKEDLSDAKITETIHQEKTRQGNPSGPKINYLNHTDYDDRWGPSQKNKTVREVISKSEEKETNIQPNQNKYVSCRAPPFKKPGMTFVQRPQFPGDYWGTYTVCNKVPDYITDLYEGPQFPGDYYWALPKCTTRKMKSSETSSSISSDTKQRDNYANYYQDPEYATQLIKRTVNSSKKTPNDSEEDFYYDESIFNFLELDKDVKMTKDQVFEALKSVIKNEDSDIVIIEDSDLEK